MLSEKQIKEVCLIDNQSKCCRYLGKDENNFYCLKKTYKKTIIDVEVRDFLFFCSKKNIDPVTFHLPIGDNCEGFNNVNFESEY